MCFFSLKNKKKLKMLLLTRLEAMRRQCVRPSLSIGSYLGPAL